MSKEQGPNSYQGWKSRETWQLALHIDNTQGAAQHWQDQIEELRAEHAGEGFDMTMVLADRLEYWYDDIDGHEVLRVSGTPVFRDLLQCALDRIDWMEISAHLLAE